MNILNEIFTGFLASEIRGAHSNEGHSHDDSPRGASASNAA